jgi:GH35 family endo-1,4-beta-xylanase
MMRLLQNLGLVVLFIGLFTLGEAQVFIANGSFERGASLWTNLAQEGGVATYTYATSGAQDGSNYLSANVQTLGTNAWSVQSISQTIHLVAGNTYRISFYAKANVAGKQLRAALQNVSYAAKDFTLTSAWTQYTWDITPTESNLTLRYHYFQAGVFDLDHVKISLVTAVNTPPACVLTAPQMNAYFQAGSTVTLRAYSTDFGGTGGAGTVAKVEFFNGATKIGEATSAVNNTFSLLWTGLATGSYVITAKATDNLGATFTSAGVIVQGGAGAVQEVGMSAGKSKYLANLNGYSRTDFLNYWNGVTAENACKWGSVEGTRDVMNWTSADAAYNFSKNNNLMFRYHAFAWGSQYPSWITTLTPAEFKAEMEEYMAAVAARYPLLDQIDVLNEQLGTHAGGTPYFRDGLGGTGVTGYDWQIWLFEKAREYFPNAKLVLNDYGLENDANAINTQLGLIAALRDRGLLDGFGTQAHCFNLDGFATNPALLKTRMDLMATGGLPIYVTELDLKGSATTEATQLTSYQNVFPVLWEHPAVAGITLWGYVEKSTWIAGSGILNQDGTERSAMVWLKSYLNGRPDVGYPYTISSSSSAVVSSSSRVASSSSIAVPSSSSVAVSSSSRVASSSSTAEPVALIHVMPNDRAFAYKVFDLFGKSLGEFRSWPHSLPPGRYIVKAYGENGRMLNAGVYGAQSL